ncbi:conserved Plasmodium protein, unknown function [Plasmodium yoelii]|uniref:Uncharacterized protein n=4 Tax=Plasmodium yoelii TaxID=5861 RepID=A0AAE9WZ35_PLAYO|nr:conserved Plasmodium protein, unknown function [Plasmodium yoelii]WBY59018.1 hypothetical protein Py17XNL_001204912 [Plasmodium yoelii yoelii]CDU19208.1 conserved Plasmodium protein, unknown function [Plasmodium yoelii]VTZ79843.1 conserved Plasmodium protein, unknown function [Plasmodium yoelii]|eukprot:XP_724673.2 conserved Plasmodium protein, unknown function [Plasmodium yoelii]
MIGKFISQTYDKVKNNADKVRLHVSIQAIKAKEIFGSVKPNTIDDLEVLLNLELQQIDSAEALVETYKKWIYNLSQSEESGCIRYYKNINRNNEKNISNGIRQNINRSFNSNSSFEIKTNKDSSIIPSIVNFDSLNSYKSNSSEQINTHDNNINTVQVEPTFSEKKHSIENSSVSSNPLHDNFNTTASISDITNNKNDNDNSNNKTLNTSQEDISLKKRDSFEENRKQNQINTKQQYENKNNIRSNHLNSETMTSNIYHDCYGYNFKEIFLKSNILEKSISLIIEKRKIRLSLVGPIEKDDLDNPRTTILNMFKHCLIGNEKLHKNILFIILTTDQLFDNHKEIFLELFSILKYDYKDVYLSNIRKLVSSEIVSLKNKIQSYDNEYSLPNKLSNIINNTPQISASYTDLDKCTKYLYSTESFESLSTELVFDDNKKSQRIQENLLNQDSTSSQETHTDKENLHSAAQAKQKDQITHSIDPKQTNLNNMAEENIVQKGNPDKEERYIDTKSEKCGYKTIDSLTEEREMIEINKIQQIKILASSKLLELHKTIENILLLSTKNREKRKDDIKIKLEELKKIMNVCKKDCEVILNETEDSKLHLENIYVKELNIRNDHIKKAQENINKIENDIDELTIKKNELYKEYQIICKEINMKNKELSEQMSILSLYKKELNDTEHNYLNKLSNTNKSKHMNQERKLYISNLDIISDEILKEYETSDHLDTENLSSKSDKIKIPIMYVVTKHLNYLKDKLLLLDLLLKFYLNQINEQLKNKQNSDILFTENKNAIHNDQNADWNKKESLENDHVQNTNNAEENKPRFGSSLHYDEYERKKKITKYKNSYFKVIEQISKIWITIQEFYDLNKEQIDQQQDELKQSAHSIYKQSDEIYNSIKLYITENSSLMSSI